MIDDSGRKLGGWFNRLYVIEGVTYESIWPVLREARSRGFNGSLVVLRARLKRGANTWADLARLIRKGSHVSELVAAIAAVDLRKRELRDAAR